MYLRFMNDPTNFDLYANNVYWKLNFVTEPMPNELFDVTTSKLFGFPYLPYEWDSWFAENNYPLLVAQLNVSHLRNTFGFNNNYNNVFDRLPESGILYIFTPSSELKTCDCNPPNCRPVYFPMLSLNNSYTKYYPYEEPNLFHRVNNFDMRIPTYHEYFTPHLVTGLSPELEPDIPAVAPKNKFIAADLEYFFPKNPYKKPTFWVAANLRNENRVKDDTEILDCGFYDFKSETNVNKRR
eukprot:TRINITY_DN6949_c0_g1_i2.p1 TRINITY_DN6949_c0_g1~~TRINITY_DN6949_c0_g1_i2.p1  ORF type:complete len:239 (-),score=25.69 TRINITY_DN6949_c0_g1_i2:39-755(-)